MIQLTWPLVSVQLFIIWLNKAAAAFFGAERARSRMFQRGIERWMDVEKILGENERNKNYVEGHHDY